MFYVLIRNKKSFHHRSRPTFIVKFFLEKIWFRCLGGMVLGACAVGIWWRIREGGGFKMMNLWGNIILKGLGEITISVG